VIAVEHHLSQSSERVRRLVFWNGNDRQSLLAAVPPHYRALFEPLPAASPDNSVMLPFSIWREAFINDADLDLARASYEQLSPEPYQQMTEPLDMWKFYTLDTPRSYLNGTEDIARAPAERMGLASQDVQETRAIPASPNAGQPPLRLLCSDGDRHGGCWSILSGRAVFA
jgi:hypothetical protein